MQSFSSRLENLVRPEKKPTYVLYTYNAGEVLTYRFDSKPNLQTTLSKLQKEWKRAFLYEIVEEPDEEYEQANAEYERIYAAIVTSFLRELRAEYSDIPDMAYAILINEAYDRGHSAGYDEVAGYMSDQAELYWQLAAVFSADPEHHTLEFIKEGQFIKAVKSYRDKYGVGLKEAKAACDQMKEGLYE